MPGGPASGLVSFSLFRFTFPILPQHIKECCAVPGGFDPPDAGDVQQCFLVLRATPRHIRQCRIGENDIAGDPLPLGQPVAHFLQRGQQRRVCRAQLCPFREATGKHSNALPSRISARNTSTINRSGDIFSPRRSSRRAKRRANAREHCIIVGLHPAAGTPQRGRKTASAASYTYL